jgi:CheY-like chemotaxis protein
MRSLIVASLRRSGMEVTEADNGGRLLELVGCDPASDVDEHADLVITDVNMPGTNGLAALARLRETCPDLPVIVITAFGDEATHVAAKALGATAVFDKPFDLQEFCDTVIHVLGY